MFKDWHSPREKNYPGTSQTPSAQLSIKLPWLVHERIIWITIFFLNDYSGVFRPDFYSALVPIRISQNFPENCLKNFPIQNFEEKKLYGLSTPKNLICIIVYFISPISN